MKEIITAIFVFEAWQAVAQGTFRVTDAYPGVLDDQGAPVCTWLDLIGTRFYARKEDIRGVQTSQVRVSVSN